MTGLACAHCGAEIAVDGGEHSDGGIPQCLVCRSRELFVRKAFPQRLGVAIVVLGFVGSSIAWYFYQVYWTFGILFLTAAIDVLLYLVMDEALECYRCGALYRGVYSTEGHAAFNLDTHERHRQQKARLEETRRANRSPTESS